MNVLIRFFTTLIDVMRPQLGLRGSCIYPITCTTFAKSIIREKPLAVALLLIGKRLFFCNPITGLVRRWQRYS